MATTRTIKSVLQWVTDQSSLAKTIADTNKVGTAQVQQAKRVADATTGARNITAAYDKVLGKLGATSSASMLIVEQRMRDAEADTERLRRTTDATGKEYDDLTRSANRAADATARAASASNSRGGRFGSALENADRFGTVGSQIFGGLGNSSLANVTGLIGDAAQGFATLNPIMATTIAVGGGLSVAMQAVQNELAKTKERADAFATRTATNADLIAGGATTAEVTQSRNRLQEANAFVTATYTGLASIRDQLLQIIPNSASESAARTRNAANRLTGAGEDPIFAEMNRLFEQASLLTGESIKDMSQLQQFVNSLAGQTNEYGTEVYRLNGLLNSGALAANDNRAAVEKFTDAFQERFREGLTGVIGGVKEFFNEASEAYKRGQAEQLAIVTDSIGYSQQLQAQIRTATVEQVADRLYAIQEESRAIETFLPQLEELAPASQEATQALEQAQTRLGRLSDDFGDVVTRVLPQAIQRAQAALFEAEGEARTKSQAKLLEIERDRQEKENEAAQQRDKEEAEVRRQAAADLGDSLAKIQEQSDERIKQISINGKRSILRAIAAGDQAQAIQQLEDQEFAKQEEEQQAAKAEIEKRKEIDKRLGEQLQTIKTRYDEQVQAVRAAATKSTQTEQARLKAELAEREKAYREQLDLLNSFRVNGTNQIAMFVDGANSQLARLGSNATSSVTTTVHGTNDRYADTSRFPTVSSILEDQARRNGVTNSNDARAIRGAGGFDSGGYNSRPGFYYSGVPELHIPIADVNRFAGGTGSVIGGTNITVNINGSGLNEQQLTRAIASGIKQAKPEIAKDISDNMARSYRQRGA